MNEGDLSKLAFHLLGRGDPAGVPEPQLPIEAPPKGPDLPTGCCQHAEVPGGSLPSPPPPQSLHPIHIIHHVSRLGGGDEYAHQ
jgi:hypothetical protein